MDTSLTNVFAATHIKQYLVMKNEKKNICYLGYPFCHCDEMINVVNSYPWKYLHVHIARKCGLIANETFIHHQSKIDLRISNSSRTL